MPNYKETTISGTSWKRARLVTIHNQLGVKPSIIFVEEDAINVGDKTINGSSSVFLNAEFEPTSAFNVINPETGEPTGTTMTHADLYVALHSLYIDLATKRDTPIVEG